MRQKTQGRFSSRRALEDRVVFLFERGKNCGQIAEHCGICRATAATILQRHRAGKTVSERLAAGECSWDIDADSGRRRERWERRFDPGAPILLETYRVIRG